ncbi:acyl-CoA dehydrogenase family protein [Streptomyces sp. NBC_00083]|uniref:acyl-CoA dehydrogenase family protein n=1 Tax=Streptomyces sp. NBC_00083 TaxID=2975647 RepID=UPI002251A6F8|nr:acyl-CoA dehydrogenase family protein [Streptomyces sp. NBC_00083]MCX5386204.1 acyl-CoA dehydrogenase family protein [Streptomyces sp. NBC_00083]
MNYALFSGLDEEFLALPFYEEQHRTTAVELAEWCVAHADLWSRPLERTPEKAGREILSALGSAGWLGFLDPANRPDAGGLRSVCLAREILAYADDLADFAFSIQALSATPILRWGSSAQQGEYLPRMASGEVAGSFAISEEEAGSDISAVGLTADRVSGGYLLNGRKAWIAHAGIADVHCVIARTGEGPGALGLTAFLVPAHTPGVRVLEEVPLVAPRSFGHLAFDDCLVPESSVLGRPGHGFVVATDLLERFRMTVGAAAVGFARRARDSAVQRARERRIHGGRLLDLQLVKGALADMEIKLNASALLVARAAWEFDHENPGCAKHSSIAKVAATEAAQEIVDAAVQLHGAAGLVADSVPERLYRQVRSLRIYEGASEVQKLIIADALGRRPHAGRSRVASDVPPSRVDIRCVDGESHE